MIFAIYQIYTWRVYKSLPFLLFVINETDKISDTYPSSFDLICKRAIICYMFLLRVGFISTSSIWIIYKELYARNLYYHCWFFIVFMQSICSRTWLDGICEALLFYNKYANLTYIITSSSSFFTYWNESYEEPQFQSSCFTWIPI